jgi:SLOG cluster3 family
MTAMKEVFLSTSIPEKGRGNFDDTADPFLIQYAVRELVTVCLGRQRIVWGGHPSITPMVHAVCVDMGVEDFDLVQLYQSKFYDGVFPDSNRFFAPQLTPKVPGGKTENLTRMRSEMLSRPNLHAAVFIGGMDGIFEECELFLKYHKHDGTAFALTAPGGAARELADRYGIAAWDGLDFARFFYSALDIDPAQRPRL